MTQQYIRKPSCETVVLDHECMILHSEAFTITKINETGSFLWGLLSSAQTVASLAEAVAGRCGGCGQSVEQDIRQFLSDMMGCGLIEYAN